MVSMVSALFPGPHGAGARPLGRGVRSCPRLSPNCKRLKVSWRLF